MLAGVGGCTIAEAQSRLSYQEWLLWMKYRAKRGTFNLGMRVERGSALLATLYANVHSKHGGHKITDFMPHEEETVLSLEQAMESWS